MGGALALGPLLAGCGNGGEEQGSSRMGEGGSGGPWSFKDDRGRTVKLDKRPETLVAYVSTAAALYVVEQLAAAVRKSKNLDA
ncbi:hypothetical protein RCO28_06360 [Streptomyces sp. LHD-70]|uniref:hypothetical protein n=1 Tax=Streptomyces sp. LHD-70 TaxID=3072140 RepID=UPI00280C85BA|nr:hypothetical protein [Streptomyces sp. LHD-70]MDQ8702115.1 hypothetical protein [Streptomyces sp. LHD-70]